MLRMYRAKKYKMSEWEKKGEFMGESVLQERLEQKKEEENVQVMGY